MWLTLAICHWIEETPGSVLTRSGFHKSHIVGCLDADDSKELHEQPRNRTVFSHYLEVMRNWDLFRRMIEALGVRMRRLQALPAECCTFESHTALQGAKTLTALELCQLPANCALPRGYMRKNKERRVPPIKIGLIEITNKFFKYQRDRKRDQ